MKMTFRGNTGDLARAPAPGGEGLSLRVEAGGTLVTGYGIEVFVQGPDAAGLALSDIV